MLLTRPLVRLLPRGGAVLPAATAAEEAEKQTEDGEGDESRDQHQQRDDAK